MAKKETSKKKETTKKEEKNVVKINVIKVDVKNIKNPISRVEITQDEWDKKPHNKYFINPIVAKQMANFELEDAKSTMEREDYTNCYWNIQTFI